MVVYKSFCLIELCVITAALFGMLSSRVDCTQDDDGIAFLLLCAHSCFLSLIPILLLLYCIDYTCTLLG